MRATKGAWPAPARAHTLKSGSVKARCSTFELAQALLDVVEPRALAAALGIGGSRCWEPAVGALNRD